MYPGYSIKEHKYGEAAERFGNYAAEAKRRGEDVKPEGVDYEIGQSKALSSMRLEQMRAKMAAQNGGGSASNSAPAEPTSTEKKVRFSDISQDTAKPDGQMFFMDSQPTPIQLPTTLNASHKRKGSSPDPKPAPEPVEAQPLKKAKRIHVDHATNSDDPKESAQPTDDAESGINDTSKQAPKDVQIEYEDISAEVSKRMKEKEAKRKKKDQPKEKKKRKRESEGSTVGAFEKAATTEVEKPKKKKKKSETTEHAAETAETAEKVSPINNTAAASEEVVEGGDVEHPASVEKPKKKKKSKSAQEAPASTKDESALEEAGEGSMKKKKKQQADIPIERASQAESVAADSSPAKRSLIEDQEEHVGGEATIPKKKKAKTSKGATT
ncbi:MAG: hypothetical protein Q9169_001371 [Polycauliona sp. 2 TL-2023]